MTDPEPDPTSPPAPVADDSAAKSKKTEPFLPLPGAGRLPIHTVIVGASLFGWLFGKP